MSSATRELEEWVLAVLLLGFAALLNVIGVAERDADLIAGGLAIAIVVLGGGALYHRVTGQGAKPEEVDDGA